MAPTTCSIDVRSGEATYLQQDYEGVGHQPPRPLPTRRGDWSSLQRSNMDWDRLALSYALVTCQVRMDPILLT